MFEGLKAVVIGAWNNIAASFPAAIAFTKTVEASFPPGTPGATKPAVVRELLEKSWTTIAGVEAKFEDAWPTLEALISVMVGAFNREGVFAKKAG